MAKRKLIILTGIIACLSTSAQVYVNWVNYPGGVSIAADDSNNVYTANWEYNPGGDITLTKRDPEGNIIWEEAFDNTNNTRHEVATWVETDGQGNIVVSGTIRSGYSNPVDANSLVMKYDPSGNLLWRVVYETDFDGSSTKKILIDEEDNIYALGLGNSGSGMVTTVKKFNSNGDPLWIYFDTAGIGAPVNFKFTPDDGILITSRSFFGSINGYAKIDRAGNNIWTYPGINSLSLGDAAGDTNGNSYLVHGEYIVSNPGSVIKKLSPSGTLIWEKTNTMLGFRIEVGSDNNPVISGFPDSGTVGAAFMKYDSEGNVLWQNLDADGPVLSLLSHSQMRLDGLNAAYLAAGTMFEMAVCKINSNGSPAWTATTTGSYAYSIDFGTDTSVFVVGGTTARLTQSGTVTAVTEEPVQEITIYPNPSDDILNVQYEVNAGDGDAVLMIYDLNGKLVVSGKIHHGNAHFDIKHLLPGIYMIRLDNDQNTAPRKLIVL